eukprot:scaffold5354_cov234-Chaetoceros_neogracile.AAC.5
MKRVAHCYAQKLPSSFRAQVTPSLRPIPQLFISPSVHTIVTNARHACHTFSTQTMTKDVSIKDKNSSDKQLHLSLKKLVRPFLMKFHPDRQEVESKQNTEIAREVNQKALQTINGMIDTVDQVYNRAADPSRYTTKGRIDVQNNYTVEFLVHSEAGMNGVKKPKNVPIASRRSVELVFRNREINSVQMIDSNGNYSVQAAAALKVKAMKEIAKLLRVAGLQIPKNLHSHLEEVSKEAANPQMSQHARLLQDELNFDGDNEVQSNLGRSFNYGSTRPLSPFEKSRQKYKESVDWNKYNEVYKDAVKDMEKDLATEGLISMNEERKQRLVAEIISRIRVFNPFIDDKSNWMKGDEMSESLDVLHQLIAIRRLSLLLNDNFQELEMEEMGRLWETLIFVFVPERKAREQGKTGLPYSRLKRLRKGTESGFKFSYHADDRVTVYVPIDFLDDEFLGELKSHLSDFYSMCLSKGGLEDYFPSNYSDFRGQANMDDD